MTDFSDIKFKALVTFPGNIIGGVGLSTTKTSSNLTINLDYSEFGTISSIPTSTTNYILTYDTATHAYAMISSALLGSSGTGLAEAPIDGSLYGRQSAAWVQTVANPTASIGLSTINGTAMRALRSDAAPALSQAIIPTWTGLHTFNGGSVHNAAPSVQASSYGYFDPNPLTQSTLAATAARTAGAEANVVLHMASSVGAASGAGAYKANLLTDSVANLGSAPIWSQASVVTMNSGFIASGVVCEADLNVFNINYGNSIATGPFAINFFATGTHDSNHFFGTAAFAASATQDSFPLWNYGIYLGAAGYKTFNTASIIDLSDAPTSISITGSRTGYAIQVQNAHATAGDVGILLGVGLNGTTDTSTIYMNFANAANSAQAGNISRADSAGVRHVAYNVTSDQRLKKSLGLLSNGLDTLLKIKVHRYQGKDYTGDDYDVGFFAQELHQVFPFAVTPSEDPDYHARPWQVDYGRLTPLLVAALQELVENNGALEKRIAELERKP